MAKVVGIDIIEPAIQDARANAQLNGITNCEFIAGKVGGAGGGAWGKWGPGGGAAEGRGDGRAGGMEDRDRVRWVSGGEVCA